MTLSATELGIDPAGTVQPKAAVAARLWARLRRLRVGMLVNSRLLALLLLVAIAGLRIEDSRPLELIRLEAIDTMQRLFPRAVSSGAVAIVDVDEASLARFGQWPWSRSRIAEMVAAMDAAGAAVIGFDILFAEPDRLSPPNFGAHTEGLPDALRAVLMSLPESDQELAETIAGAPVVLGRAMTNDPTAVTADHGTRSTPVATFGEDPSDFLFSYDILLANLSVLERSAAGLGAFTLSPEPDGVVRRVPAILRVGDTIYPTLSLEMLRVAAGAQHFDIHGNNQGAGVEAVGIGALRIPTDRTGRIWLHYAPSTPELYVSARDLLDGTLSPGALEGKFVLVGTSATGLRDLRITPLTQSIAGVEIHAQLIDSVLRGEVLAQPPFALGVEVTLTMVGGLLLIVMVPRARAVTSLAIVVSILALAWGTSLYGFLESAQVFDATLPTIAAIAVFALLAYANYAREERKRRQIRDAFGQYLSPALVRQLESHPERLRLGGESRELTFLFTDLEGFTALVEFIEPARLVALLNEYLDGMCEIVIRHGGTIDKIVGDAIHVMFGAPVPMPDHAARAVLCAQELDRFGTAFRQRWRENGVKFGNTRIGVNTGTVVVGNFGGTRRLDYTAHGDAINTAARLEQANKHLGTRICVADSTVGQCPDGTFRPIGALSLRGKSQRVHVYEPVASYDDAGFMTDYLAAFALLKADDGGAADAFARLAAAAPDDPAVKLHLRRLQAGERGVDLAA